ncbi:MAG TPA: hypothetical protein VNV42_09695 [Solirubrobacteraceae bacterium]|nr:hypothetical protein [Solirubrobacteraceae bacterium]
MPSEAHIHGGADPERRNAGAALAHAWKALDRDRRLAAIAALALFVTMLLPWYQQNAVVTAEKTAPLVSRNLNAFQVFTFVEAAVLLVAVAVLFLLYMRAEGRNFRLPGGDGGVVLAAGLWAALLLILRLFDKPGITQHGVAANVGIQWGIFFALAAAGLLAYAGSRMRAGQRPEPPLLRRDRPRRPSPAEPADDGEPLVDWSPPEPADETTAIVRRTPPAPEQEPTVVVRRTPATPAPRSAPPTPPVPAKPRGRYPPAPGEEQLSFEDPPPR